MGKDFKLEQEELNIIYRAVKDKENNTRRLFAVIYRKSKKIYQK